MSGNDAAGAPAASAAIRARGLIAVHQAVDVEAGRRGDARVPVAALRGLDLDVADGELAAVVGPSGSGKTTLLRILAGAERPTAGSLAIFGTTLDRATDAEIRHHRRAVVGVVDQHYRRALSPYLPTHEIVELPLAVRGVDRRAREQRARELLEAVGLGRRADATPGELSGGEQQRLAVAAALAIRPRLLLADEPTGELDAAATDSLLALVRDLIHAERVTAVIVTHDAAVEAVADRVVVLQDGRSVAERIGPSGVAERPLVDGAGWRAPERTWRHAAPPSPATPGAAAALVPAAGAALGSAIGKPAEDRGDGRAPTPVAVLVDSVSRRYGSAGSGIVAIEDLSAALPSGGVHVVTGPSGSGKSTLLRLIAGLDRPDAGRVVVLGQDLAELDREAVAAFRARRIGVAEQARGLVPFLDVRENVALALAIRDPRVAGLPGAASVDELLGRLGIGHLRTRRPAELSAGERTRVAIARALVAGPELLLLDEPTATLDRVSARSVADLLAELGRDLTVVVATHDPVLVALSGSAIEMRRGTGTLSGAAGAQG